MSLWKLLRARKARNLILTAEQRDVVIGSLLGDGHLVATTRGFAFRVNHGLIQKAYVDWKYSQLEELTNSSPRASGNCYYFRTVSHPYFDELRRLFYRQAQKILPLQLDEWFTPLVLAVWIMDDGARDGRQLRINSQCFSAQENTRLIEIMKAKLGITASLNRDKGKFRLRIAATSMSCVRQIVAPYIVPSMQYKLSL